MRIQEGSGPVLYELSLPFYLGLCLQVSQRLSFPLSFMGKEERNCICFCGIYKKLLRPQKGHITLGLVEGGKTEYDPHCLHSSGRVSLCSAQRDIFKSSSAQVMPLPLVRR